MRVFLAIFVIVALIFSAEAYGEKKISKREVEVVEAVELATEDPNAPEVLPQVDPIRLTKDIKKPLIKNVRPLVMPLEGAEKKNKRVHKLNRRRRRTTTPSQ